MNTQLNEPLPTVLVVDDAPEIRTLVGALLERHAQVRLAESGPRALEMVAREPRPDLVLLDVVMPGMDGYEVLKRLRKDEASRDIPVIFLTALGEIEEEEHGLALGAVDYIVKPIHPGILLARVRTHLELKRARDWLRDQNAFLEAEVARRMADNLTIQDVSIRALARLADVRCQETGRHILRTQAYVRLLAHQLARHPRYAAVLTPAHIDVIAKSAPLHDIGKVGVPDHILRKPGQLSPDEWEIMKTHARLGSDAIENAERDADRPVEFLSVAKQIARSHHERWDGTGYPDGLAGDAIPLPARMMALADVFDALVSHRDYKPAVPVERVIDYIVARRGTQFDPDVVDAFLAARADFIQVANRHADVLAAAA